MKKLLFLLFLIPTYVFSQNQESYLEVSGKVTDEKSVGLDSCWVKVKRDGSLADSLLTSSNGKFKFDSLIAGHVYEIHFILETYSYKFVEVDLSAVPPNDYTKFPIIIDMALFSTKYILDRKIEFLKTEPIAKAFYNPKTENLEWDGGYFLLMKNKIEEAKK